MNPRDIRRLELYGQIQELIGEYEMEFGPINGAPDAGLPKTPPREKVEVEYTPPTPSLTYAQTRARYGALPSRREIDMMKHTANAMRPIYNTVEHVSSLPWEEDFDKALVSFHDFMENRAPSMSEAIKALNACMRAQGYAEEDLLDETTSEDEWQVAQFYMESGFKPKLFELPID